MSDSVPPAAMNDPATSAKLGDKNLLDNVSLMTTLSPMPSNNTSLQPHGTSTQELLDGIFGSTKGNVQPTTLEDNHVSTFDDMQEKLRAQIEGNSTGGTENDAGTGKVMYGFDLSPIHSVDKQSTYTSTQEEPPTTEKLNRRGDFDASPNFMQASRQLKSDKGLDNNDSETMMSQVFSSQDLGTSMNLSDKQSSGKIAARFPHEMDICLKSTGTKKLHKGSSKAGKKPITRPSSASQKNFNNTPSKISTRSKSTLPKSPLKKPMNTAEFVVPKSPPSRKAVIQVTPRIKPASKKQIQKDASPKPKQSISAESSKRDMSPIKDNKKFSRLSQTLNSSKESEMSNVGVRKQNHDETVSLIHILEDLNQMRSQVADSHEKLLVVSEKNDQLMQEKKDLEIEMAEFKKENFVLKSRLDRLTSLGRTAEEAVTESEPEKARHDREEMERLIIGYQRENEKIYRDLKKLKQSNKEAEEAMFEENLKLRSEVAQLKEELELQNAINKAQIGSETGANVNVEESGVEKHDMAIMKKRIESLENELRAEEGLKMKSESLVRKLTEERDVAEKKLVENNFKFEESYDKLASKHKAEIAKLESELESVRRSLHGKSDTAITIRDIMSTPPSKSVLSHFQKRVKKLEEELENRDSLANSAVASVQKQYSEVKKKYEQRINDLERQIQLFRTNHEPNDHHVNESESLKKQLAEALSKLKLEESHRKMEKDALTEQMNALRQQQLAIKEKSSNASTSAAQLMEECSKKDREIARLKLLIEKLKSATPKSVHPRRTNHETRPRTGYNPESFKGEGYAGLVEMNAKLKRELEDKELELKHASVTKDATITKLEQDINSQRLAFEKEMAELRVKIQTEASKPENTQKYKVSCLENELHSRYKEISELRQELAEMSVFKVREQALQAQIQQLLIQVHEARVTSPSQATRRVSVLEDKLRVLEERLRLRETELTKIRFGNTNPDLLSELHAVRTELERKNQEMTRFRLELDSILLVLKELHSQGVKIPLPHYLNSIF